MNTNSIFIFFLILSTTTLFCQEKQNWSANRPDGHAPIGVMGDHTHHKGEMMFSYKYMPMWMKGNIEGDSAIPETTIFQNHMATPQQMQMNMHMIGTMYAPSEKITLMLMAHYISNNMTLKTKMGMIFSTESQGFGDIALSALVQLAQFSRKSVHATLGVSIPTGNIDQRGDTPMMNNAQLAYPMQLGSGTWDPILGITYLGQSDDFSWGAQTKYTFRATNNSESYRLGNQFLAAGWAALKMNRYFSFSGRLRYIKTNQISGKDNDMNPMLMPLFNASNSGRNQIDAGIGINFYLSDGSLKNLRFATEILLPLKQNVNGIQMKNTALAIFGIQYAL